MTLPDSSRFLTAEAIRNGRHQNQLWWKSWAMLGKEPLKEPLK
jgi:hypothetical protein